MKQKNELVEIKPREMNIEALISQGIDKNLSVDTMERLLTIRRELKAEKAKEEFDKAMSAFQKKMPIIRKTTQGYNYKYATLDEIVEQIKELLSKNGFSYTFDTDEAPNGIVVYCKVKHISGHTEISKVQIAKETTTKMNASQQSGSVMTYGKRYALTNAFALVVGGEDNDAANSQPQEVVTSAKQPESLLKAATEPYRGKGINKANATCFSCGAPTGKMHATACKA